MALIRWEPAREVDTLQNEVNRVFDAFFGNGPGTRVRRWVPAMDLVETDDQLVLRADLPGLTKEDVELEVKDGVLTVSGERKAEHEEKSEGYYRVERAFGRFSRSLTVPDGIDAETITAAFEDGVLEVRIPKPAERKPHRISIGAEAGADVNGSATETTES
jgi:HSP20 family protein